MNIALIESPDGRALVLADGVLVYGEDPARPGVLNGLYDAEWVAEALARAVGPGTRVDRVSLPADFAVMDEDGPSNRWTFEDAAAWWNDRCAAAAETEPPPAYPTVAEQLLGIAAYHGVAITPEIRDQALGLEQAILRAPPE